MQLMQTMAPLNNLTVLTQGPLNIRSRTRSPPEQMVQALWINELEPDTIYIEHCNWLNFHRYQLPRPIYINLVRDPVERMISWYYYVRSGYRNAILHRRFPNTTIKTEKWFKKSYNDCVRSGDPECQYVPGSVMDAEGNYKRQTLFFCGHSRECLPFDSQRAIQLAKLNVERDYAVVGTWEETNITLTVLEAYVPRFFKGVRDVFENLELEAGMLSFNRYLNTLALLTPGIVSRIYLHSIHSVSHQPAFLGRVTLMNMNNTRFAALEVVVFNRPTRVESEQLMPLFRQLAAMNDINVVLNGPVRTMNRTRTEKEQSTEMEWASELEKGSIYMAHSNWLDFAGFGYKKPIYVSLVRDPIDRVVTDFYKRRSWVKRAIFRRMYPGRRERPEEWYNLSFSECVRSGDPECRFIQFSVSDYVQDFKRQSLYFCGNEADCLPFNSHHAIQVAKRRVEKEYSVVGTLEETNITLTVFEKYIPRFFNHARFLYKLNSKSIRNRNRNNRKPRIDPDVREMVRRNFTNEYEFYYFCKQRLYKQYLALQLENNLK